MADNNQQPPNQPNDPQFNAEMPQQPGGYPPPPPGGNNRDNNDDDGYELDSGMPSVAAAPGRVLIVILGLVVGIGFILYLLFSDDEEQAQPSTSIRDEIRESPIAEPAPAPSRPVALPPRQLSVPEPPAIPAPPPPPPPAPAPTATIRAEAPDNAKLSERERSKMLVHGGRGGVLSASGNQDAVGRDPSFAFNRGDLALTQAPQAEATRMGNINYIIAQGKMVDAILETPINTDLPGPLRAIVSRDVYAESGRHVMIPKGSRLIGTYQSSIERNQKRVYVIWNRLIRPDGVDVQIQSPGTDQLGRAGVAGHVDNKYYEMFASSILTSSIAIALGVGADALLDDNGTSQTSTSDGTTTSSGSAGSQAVLEGVRDFSDTSQSILRGILEQPPTITVDQGTRIKVFVNRDLIMPSSVIEGSQFIQ